MLVFVQITSLVLTLQRFTVPNHASSRIAKTPKAPYFAVTTTAQFKSNIDGYFEMAELLLKDVQQAPGYLGVEISIDGDYGIAISYWRSEHDILSWSRQSRHSVAKKMAKEKWFDQYITRIAKVERDY